MKDMRKTYNRCGFAVFGVAATVAIASLALGIIVKLMGDAASGFYSLYEKYILLFNEAVIALSILIGALILSGAKSGSSGQNSFISSNLMSAPASKICGTSSNGTMLRAVRSERTSEDTINESAMPTKEVNTMMAK